VQNFNVTVIYLLSIFIVIIIILKFFGPR